MDIPTLKLPDENKPVGENAFLSQLIRSSQDKNSFVGTFRSRLSASVERCDSVRVNKNQSTKAKAKELCSHINAAAKNTRRELDRVMQEYIIQHDGVIEAWPFPWADGSEEWGLDGFDSTTRFNYFGADYYVARDRFARTSEEPVYRNEYVFPGTHEYHAAQTQISRLDKEITEAEKKNDSFTRSVALLAGSYCAYAIIVMLADILFGFGDALFLRMDEWIGTLDGAAHGLMSVVYILAVLPSMILGLLQSMSRNPMIVLGILLAGALIFGVVFGFGIYREFKAYQKTYRQAKKEKARFLKSDDYRQAIRENAALKKANEELAEQWHRAWFRWVETQHRENGSLFPGS